VRLGLAYPNAMKPDTSPVLDGTEKDFRDLLDLACTTIVQPSKPGLRAPKGKPESASAPKAE